jgi:hypothetical protein
MFCLAGGANRFTRPTDKSHAGSFAGAACLKQFVAIHAPKKIALGPVGTIQSGLRDVASRSLNDGAKSGSPPGLGRLRATTTCHPFEDEDDDEYEDEGLRL